MELSPDATLLYVLDPSGVVGRLSAGRIARNGSALVVYDAYGRIIEYLSDPGGKIRSWCVLGPEGRLIEGWSYIQDQDRPRVLPFKDLL